MASLEFDSYITPDGIEYRLNDERNGRVLITGVSGRGMPQVEYSTEQGPNQHGNTVTKYRLAPRVLQMLLRQYGGNQWNYWEKQLELIDIFRPNRVTVGNGGRPVPGQLRKILPDGSIWDIDVHIEDSLGITPEAEWNEWSYQEPIRLIAPDPTWYNPTADVLNVAAAGGSDLVFPITFPITFGSSLYSSTTQNITYTGTARAYPVITLTGPMLAFTLDNVTTGEHLLVSRNLAAGETAVVDLRYGRKTVYDGSGNDLGTGSVSTDSDLGTFHIEPAPQAPGGVNEMDFIFSGIGTGTAASLAYNTRRIGI